MLVIRSGYSATRAGRCRIPDVDLADVADQPCALALVEVIRSGPGSVVADPLRITWA